MMGGIFSSFRAVFKPNSDRHCRSTRGSLRRSSSCQPKPPTRANFTEADGEIKVLTVKGVDVKISENGKAHHTDKFYLVRREKDPRLVVRRGQGFSISLTLSRNYDTNKDAISFIFTFADDEKPNHGHGTLVAIPLLPKGENSGATWNAELESSLENVVTIWITTSPNSLIGQWKMDIDTKLKNGSAVSYNYKPTIFILYNPWCKEDSVYMEGESLRTEYVLGDTGLIWRGTANRLRPTVWKYAQFEKDVLECSLYLISKIGKVGLRNLNDPVKMSRCLSAAVNSPDDYGAVMGNWTTDFGGGTPPTKWLGSMKILQQYWKTKKPVKYGQCWVFAGVLTTIARAIGIPSRIITCYAAAHDTQNSLTVDYFVDENGEVMEELNSDSIWNYHVWNEVWMRRQDLNDHGEYDGWQAVDATPQELSDEMFRCGPASIVSVKRGEVLKPYDNGFLYSEVNADKVFWKYSGPTQPLKLLRKDVTGIGQLMSTKAVAKWTREDVTKSYKYPEKSPEERDAMLRALRQSESLFSRYYLNEEFNDIHFDFSLRDDIVIGSPFTVIVIITNRNREKDHKVHISLRVDAVTYTGRIGDAVKKQKYEPLVKAGTVEEIKLNVSYDEYYKRLCDQCAFNIACLATVVDTNYEYFAQDDFRVRKPDIKIKFEGEAIEGQELKVDAFFTNPLPIPLKKGEFRIEGPGITKQLKIKLSNPVQPNEEAKCTFKLKPPMDGRQTIIAKFTANELDDVDGFLNFMVSPKKDKSNGTTA